MKAAINTTRYRHSFQWLRSTGSRDVLSFILPGRLPKPELLDAEIDKRQQQHRRGANDKHPAPAELFKEQPIGDGRQQIAGEVSRLEQAGHQAARASGIVSIASEEATPQIPPIATPYSTRSGKNSINDGAAAESSSKSREEHNIEHQDWFATKLLRRPAEN